MRSVAVATLDVLEPGARPGYVFSSELVPGAGHDIVNEFLRQTDVVLSDVFPCVAVPLVMPIGVAVRSEKARSRLERVLVDAG